MYNTLFITLWLRIRQAITIEAFILSIISYYQLLFYNINLVFNPWEGPQYCISIRMVYEKE